MLCTLVVLVAGCGGSPSTPAPRAPEPRASAARPEGWLCRSLVGQFVALPAEAGAGAAEASPPSAGRWWIRGCSLSLEGGQLRLRLSGPGWYWVESRGEDLMLRQQVPFELGTDVVGTIRTAYRGAVGSLWFEPSSEPEVHLAASADLELRGASAWGAVLMHVPFLPVRAKTAERLSKSAEEAFRVRLRRGLTVTYEPFRGQADMSLGQLAPGETPRRPFHDGLAWITNERLLLPVAATHVFGPLEPGPLSLDARIERGPGLVYRALCVRDMARRLGAVAAGRPERIPAAELVASGSITGGGAHAAELTVHACAYYLVISSAPGATTLAALRLRS